MRLIPVSFFLVCICLNAVGGTAWASSRSLITFSGSQPVVLPARFVDGEIVLRVTINGRGLDFGVDTGANVMTIDPGVASQLGLASEGSYVSVPSMQIGDVTLSGVALRKVALGDSVGQSGPVKVVGLLGYDFLASGVFALDLKRESLIVYPPGTAPLKDPALQEVPAGKYGLLSVPVSFDGIEGRFILDTGAEDTEIYQHFLDKLPVHQMLGGYKTLNFVGSTVRGYAVEVRDLEFGGITYETAAALIPEQRAEIPGFDGLIGRDVLQDYVLYIDYGHGAIFVKPNSQ